MIGPIARLMIPVMGILLLGVFIVNVQEWLRLRNGCGKHEWINHVWNEPDNRQVRWCNNCGIRQARISDQFVWGEDYL